MKKKLIMVSLYEQLLGLILTPRTAIATLIVAKLWLSIHSLGFSVKNRMAIVAKELTSIAKPKIKMESERKNREMSPDLPGLVTETCPKSPNSRFCQSSEGICHGMAASNKLET